MFRIERHVSVFLVVALSTCYNVSGSQISLIASSPSIHPLLTSQLTVRCSLKDTAPSSSLIGRSATSTSENAKFVTSISLFLNNADIASVSVMAPAKSLLKAQNVNVSGGIPGINGDKGFLEFKLTYPTDSQTGNFTCQISAIDGPGHNVVYSTSVHVDITAPTVSDLVQHIHQLNVLDHKKTEEITRLTNQVNQLQDKDLRNKAEIASNKANIAILTNLVTQVQESERDNKAGIERLESELNATQHLESGVIVFGALGGPAVHWDGATSRSQSVTFTSPYDTPPTVHLAMLDAHIHKDYHAYLDVNLVNSDEKGFAVEVHLKSDDLEFYLEHLRLSWFSYP